MMRAAFVATMQTLLDRDPRVVLLLGDIMVRSFERAAQLWPERVLNVGVNEAGMIGLAAGLAKQGFYPVVVSIAPFVTSRVHEFIRNDLAMQGLAAAVVSVGGSHDYSGLGPTHQAPDDIALMLAIPGVTCCVPGDGGEAEGALRDAVKRRELTYVRLSDQTHAGLPEGPTFNPIDYINTLVFAVGPTLRYVPRGVPYVYVNRLPFDTRSLVNAWPDHVLVLEPFYVGTITHLITDALRGHRVEIRSLGVPREWPGLERRTDETCGLSLERVQSVLEGWGQ